MKILHGLLNLSDKSYFEIFKLFLKIIFDVVAFLVIALYFFLEALVRLFIPVQPKSLKGEIILVTGAGSGIGRQTCLQLADEGATIVCWDIDYDKTEQIVQELRNSGSKAIGYKVDVSDVTKVKAAALRVKQEVGDVTIIINNAGIMVCKKFLSMNSNDFERTFQINVLAHFWVLQEFLPKMVENNHGHVVALASACGFVPSANVLAYNASKSAVIMYMDSLRQELRSGSISSNSNVHVTTVYPMGCKTDMLNGLTCTNSAGINPLFTPEYVANCVIHGLKRNYEYVYVPGLMMITDCLAKWIPSKVLTAGFEYIGIGVRQDVRS